MHNAEVARNASAGRLATSPQTAPANAGSAPRTSTRLWADIVLSGGGCHN